MRLISAVLCFVYCINVPAYAHVDAILTMKSDGTIPEIPAQLGKAKLQFDALGTPNAVVSFTVGSKLTTLPSCMARLITARGHQNIQLVGSWYHEEAPDFPYYVVATFLNSQKTESQWFMFSLRDARLLHYGGRKYISEAEWEGTELRVPSNCKAQHGTVTSGTSSH